jgi:hypothetical protein
MTPGGQRAAEIRRWAWQDPAGRVHIAIAQVNDLADAATDEQELREIGDSATMLSRLASSLEA